MKRLLVSVLVLSAAALAQTPFDGTWVANLGTTQLSPKPFVFAVRDGRYICSTCIPKINIKADGTQQAIAGSHYADSMAIKVLDGNTIEETDMLAGKVVYKETDTVSADEKTLTAKFEDTSENSPVTGERISSRVGKGPAGSHAISGSWKAEKLANLSSNGATIKFESTDNGLKMSDTNGQSYDAKFDGKDYEIAGDPGHTMVSLKKVDDHTIDETDKQDGKVVSMDHITVSPDGKTMTYLVNNIKYGRTSTFTLDKQ